MKKLLMNSILFASALFFIGCPGGKDKDNKWSYTKVGSEDFEKANGDLTAKANEVKAQFGGEADEGRQNVSLKVKLVKDGEAKVYGYADKTDLSGGFEVKFTYDSETSVTVVASFGGKASNPKTLGAGFVTKDGESAVLTVSIDFLNDLVQSSDNAKQSAVLLYKPGESTAAHTLGEGDTEVFSEHSSNKHFGLSLKNGSMENKADSAKLGAAKKAKATPSTT